ncbi:MAG: hypothetical protein JSV12_02180 [Candidatus Bathyarchaeota archaeon]|nr:MAG: hypothetical protein JSV12_02180 [Candidatus Bathyarchaeota archaeon]
MDRIWETFIKIPSQTTPQGRIINLSVLYDIVRFKIYPLTTQLKWYCFLVHMKGSGVPTTEDDKNPYYHIRFEPDNKEYLESLPEYCVMTRKAPYGGIRRISIGRGVFFDTSRLRIEKIEEVWRIIGEQSEWFINTLNAFKENQSVPPILVGQFLHYFANMTQMRVE